MFDRLRALPLVSALTLAFASTAAAPDAEAATVQKLDLPDLVAEADLVLVATVEATEAFRAGNRIMTRVTLRPGTVVKGEAADAVVVVVPGGVLGGIGQSVPGSARFAAGEEVVTFLGAADGEGRRAVVGMAQGKLRVVPGLDGGRLVRDLDGLTLVTVGADGRIGPPVAAPAEVPVTHLVAALAQMADAPRLAPPTVGGAAPAGVVKP